MKIFFGLVFLLLMQREAFAQAGLQSSSSADNGELVHKAIDHLNDVAFSIYLESPDSARAIAEKALLLAEKSEYKEGIGRSFLNIGHVYWSQSYYPIALVFLNKALINLPKDKPLLVSDCYGVIGRTYADLGHYKEAFNSLNRSELFAGNDPGMLAEIHSERSYVYMLTKDYERAIKEANLSLRLNKIVKDKNNTAVIYGRLSGIYRNKKEYKAALAYSDTAYSMSLAIHNNRLRSKTYIEYAAIYNQLHNFDKAITYAKKGAELAGSIGVIDALSAAYNEMINSYVRQNDLKNALAYQNKYIVLKDSLSKFYKAKNTDLIQNYFMLETRLDSISDFERNAKEIKDKMKLQRLIIISLSLSLLVVIAVLSITWYYYKQKTELNIQLQAKHKALLEHKQLIEAQTENLQTISKIKDKLLAVIGHDLRTPLANLRNIVEMFEADYIPADEIHWLMKDINPLVKSAELTLSNLMDWAGNHIRGRSINSSRLDIFLLGVEMERVLAVILCPGDPFWIFLKQVFNCLSIQIFNSLYEFIHGNPLFYSYTCLYKSLKNKRN